jgi:hypothetical protein
LNVDKILGIPSIETGTGEAQANPVFELLDEWKVTDDIVAMSYDTTSSNTGYKKGACVWLERKMLHLSCRHHIFKLLVEKITNDHFGKSTRHPAFCQFSKSMADNR